MNHKTNAVTWPLRHAVLVLALMAGTASAQPEGIADADQAFDAAMAAYERNHWEAAYVAFAALADRGHAASGRIALQMWRHGPALYGQSFTVQTVQLRRWARWWDFERTTSSTRQ